MRIYLGHKVLLGIDPKLESVIYCILVGTGNFGVTSKLVCNFLSLLFAIVFLVCFTQNHKHYFSFSRLLVMAA